MFSNRYNKHTGYRSQPSKTNHCIVARYYTFELVSRNKQLSDCGDFCSAKGAFLFVFGDIGKLIITCNTHRMPALEHYRLSRPVLVHVVCANATHV